MGYHSCTGIEEGINDHNEGIEGGCASPVPIVTNQPPPLFVDPILRGPDSKKPLPAAPAKAQQEHGLSGHLRAPPSRAARRRPTKQDRSQILCPQPSSHLH